MRGNPESTHVPNPLPLVAFAKWGKATCEESTISMFYKKIPIPIPISSHWLFELRMLKYEFRVKKGQSELWGENFEKNNDV